MQIGTGNGVDQQGRIFLVGQGDCSDARLIHASIKVHPCWWVGYLELLPLRTASGGQGGQQIMSPGERGFASHQRILTLQFLAPHSLVLRCSTRSGGTVSGL
jgi:hypothetical protein